MVNRSTVQLYDAFAESYDNAFDGPSLRRIYDALAWEHVATRLPSGPATIVDVGAGTGRWAARCLERGHKVICIEPSPAMCAVLRQKFACQPCRIVEASVEDADVGVGVADAVLAMGSLQYSAKPDEAVARMRQWLRPGGLFCAHVDGLKALTLELLRLGRIDEALQRMEQRHGVFTYGAHQAPLHLFDDAGLRSLLTQAGFAEVDTRGLLITPSAWGRERSAAELGRDEAAFAALERRLSASPALADFGKHLIAWGRCAREDAQAR